MKTRSWDRLVFGAMLMLSVPACVSVNMERGSPARRYFVLRLDGAPVTARDNGSGVLKLNGVRVAPPYNGKGFVYRLGPQVFETDFYNQFLAAPAAMISDELGEVLRRSNLFKHVVNSGSAVEPTHLLEATVGALYGDFSQQGAGNAVLEISLIMTRDSANKPQVIFQKSYEKTLPLQERSPEALVRGWSRALEQITAALISDLKEAGKASNLVGTQVAPR
jgi:uncharacterized lipoprotein YmbA